MMERMRIISLSVHAITFREAIARVMDWGLAHTPSYVCFANAHMTIEAHLDPAFRTQVDNASLVLADGKPLAVACNSLYGQKQERISGMDFTPAILDAANETAAAGKPVSIFLYGSTEPVLEALQQKIAVSFPQVRIGGAISPPFRHLSAEETQAHIDQINASGANLVLVALGCPKQEKWMAEHSRKINAVLLGVGGAFPVMAGMQRRSPEWMQQYGLEWLHRLSLEPKRMFKRYLHTNSSFLYLMGKEQIKRRRK